MVTLPRKLWGSCKPTRHVGRALGQQRCFLKTQQFRRQERRPHAESPSHSEPTHTAEITIRAAPSAPSGLRPVWGQEPVSPTSCPLALGRWEVPSQPQAAGPQLPPPTPIGVGDSTEAWALSSPHTTGSWCHQQRDPAGVDRDRREGGASPRATGRAEDPRRTRDPTADPTGQL